MLFYKHAYIKYTVSVTVLKKVNLYVPLSLLALRVVNYKGHAGMKVFVATKWNSAHEPSRMIVPLLFELISSADCLVRNLFIFNFFVSSVSSEKFRPCTVFCSTFSRSLLFLFFCVQISCFTSARDISEYLSPIACICRCIWTHRTFFSYKKET